MGEDSHSAISFLLERGRERVHIWPKLQKAFTHKILGDIKIKDKTVKAPSYNVQTIAFLFSVLLFKHKPEITEVNTSAYISIYFVTSTSIITSKRYFYIILDPIYYIVNEEKISVMFIKVHGFQGWRETEITSNLSTIFFRIKIWS